MVKNNIKVNKFTTIIENYKFDQNRIKEIYIYILAKNNDKITEKVNEDFSNYFINNLRDLNAEGIYFLIKSCSNNKNFLKKIFNNIENYAISENDFFIPNKSPNFELYELFVKNGYINEPSYFETKYFETIAVLINKIFLEIKELRIPFLKISDLFENNKNEFLSKLKLVFINEKTKPDDLYYNVINNLELCKKKISELDKINNYLTVFEHKTSENLINIIQNIINKLRQKTILEILNEQETRNINDYQNLVKKSNNLRFKDSIIFMKLYEELKKEKGLQLTEIQLFNETLNLYQTIMKKIIDYKNVNFMNIENIEYILDLTKNKIKEIDKEMDF
jgi:aryl carrier-like protein